VPGVRKAGAVVVVGAAGAAVVVAAAGKPNGATANEIRLGAVLVKCLTVEVGG